MLSRIYNFISRHRRKFFGMAVTGAMIWGGWTYFNWRMRKSEEEYVREVLNRAKRHMHHKSSAQAAEKQAIALMPVATKATNSALDCNAIVLELKGGSVSHLEKLKDTSLLPSKDNKGVPAPLTPEERLSKWDELKRVSIARAVAFAYVPSILVVFLRLQLGLLGGYVFRSCGGDNIAAFLDGVEDPQPPEEKQSSLSVEIQEAYLSLSQYFLEGHPIILTQKRENPFRESHSSLSDACWGESNEDQNKGKSKLNLSFPSNGLNQTLGESHSSKFLQRHINAVSSPVKPVKCDSKDNLIKGNGDNQSDGSSRAAEGEEGSSLGAGKASGMRDSASQDKKVTKEQLKFESGRPGTKDKKHLQGMKEKGGSVSSSEKDEVVPNGMSSRCDSSDSGTQSSEHTHEGVSDDETGDQKETCIRESTEEDSGRCSGIDEPEEDVEVEKRKSGIEVLCSLLESKVGRVVDGTSLKMALTLADTETLFWGVLSSIRSNPAEDPAFNLPKYLLPPQDVLDGLAKNLETCLDRQAAAMFREMVSETADLLETKEVVELVQSCVSAGLGHLMDRVANNFPQDVLNLNGPQQLPTKAVVSQKIQGTSSQKVIPMAKLIPIISKVAFEDGSPWFKQLLEMSNLKDFGANVYEAFTR